MSIESLKKSVSKLEDIYNNSLLPVYKFINFEGFEVTDPEYTAVTNFVRYVYSYNKVIQRLKNSKTSEEFYNNLNPQAGEVDVFNNNIGSAIARITTQYGEGGVLSTISEDLIRNLKNFEGKGNVYNRFISNFTYVKNESNKLIQQEQANKKPKPGVSQTTIFNVESLKKELKEDFLVNKLPAAKNTVESIVTNPQLLGNNPTKFITALSNYVSKGFPIELSNPLISEANDYVLDLETKSVNGKIFDTKLNKEVDIAPKVEAAKKVIELAKTLSNASKVSKADTNINDNSKAIPTSTEKSTTPTSTTQSTIDKPTAAIPDISLPLIPDTWGIKFTTTRQASSEDIRFLATADKGTVDDNFYMDLLPARQSTIPVQGGRDVPNALPGLNYKLIPQVGKQQIPGFSPVYQNLGIKGMQVTIVGAFTGADGSYYKTDTPEPNSKTPFWSNAKGSPTLSDNPGRGGKLPELTAYNSSAEFKQVVYQGKQIEVEINLFQVYNQSTASQIGQDIKLQSKNGNPKFTGIVRSLDEYHATKERTWYTLIMDVTDFGMASKKPINLNNKLEEAIRNAQQEQETAKAAKVKSNAEQEASTIPNDPESTEVIINIKQRILALKDNNQKKKQLAIYDHLLEHIKTLKNKDNYAFKKYNGGQPWGTFISNIGTYSDSSFFPISNSQLLFRLRLDCRTLLGIQGTCDSELYWLLDGAEGNTKPITKFIGNGTRQSTFLMLPAEKRERIANDPFGFGPYPEEDGSESQRNSLLSQAKNLSNAERGALTIKAIGCVAIGALGTVASVGTAGLATPGAIATTLGACAVFTSAEAYEKYDTLNKNEAQWSNAVWGDLAMDLFFTLGTVGLVRGGSAIVSKVTKQGNTVASNQISSFISTLVNKAKANIGKTIKYGNQTAIIDAVDGIPSINGKPAVRLKVGTETRTVPIENIANELDNIVPSTVPTTTNSTSANPSTVTSSGTANISRLTKEIDALSISDEIKRYIKSLDPENQRKVLTVINTQKANSTKSFTISRQGQSDLLVKPEDAFRLSSSGFVVRKGSVVYDIPYIEVTGSKVLRASSVSNTTNQTTPPPSQSPIPQQQTTSQTTQTQQPGATYYPDGELNEVNIILGGFPERLPAKGFKMFNILKNLGYEKQFSLFKKPSIKFKNPNTNEIKTVKALSFLQGTDNGDSIYIITGNKKGVFVNLIDIISINGIE